MKSPVFRPDSFSETRGLTNSVLLLFKPVVRFKFSGPILYPLSRPGPSSVSLTKAVTRGLSVSDLDLDLETVNT